MCGIAGLVQLDGREAAATAIEAMLASIAHRGPDGSGIWTDGPVGLGHRRLSILDLSDAASQPMSSLSGRTWLTYNGEVYNFAELRAELGDVALASSGDTAVIVEYIERFGIDRFVDRAEGFFGLASWSIPEQRLTLARDRHGIKPLYLRHDGGSVRFASEMWPLTNGLSPDPLAVASMLAGRSVTSTHRTLYGELEAVLPGEIVVVDQSGPLRRRRPHRPSQFHDPAYAARLQSADDDTLVDEFEAAFRTSVHLRMTSDAPVACLASGGIDSSLIAAIAKEEGFDMPLYHADVVARTERPAAEALARHIGTELIVEQTTDDDIIAALAGVTRANEMPLTYHVNAIPFYLLARKVSADGNKVILTGEGSDEYLLGYPQYGAEWAIRLLDRVRAPVRRVVRDRTRMLADQVWFDPQNSMNSVVADLLSSMEDSTILDEGLDLSHLSVSDRRSVEQALALINGHLTSTLHRNDRLGMAWGLESRFPFLGHDLARFCLSGPARIRLRRTRAIGDKRHPFVVDKWVVREMARRRLPRDLVERPKMGFPVSIWNRLAVEPAALVDGPFASMFSLRARELSEFVAAAPPEIGFRAVLIDAWLRICVEREPQTQTETFLDQALVRIGGK